MVFGFRGHLLNDTSGFWGLGVWGFRVFILRNPRKLKIIFLEGNEEIIICCLFLLELFARGFLSKGLVGLGFSPIICPFASGLGASAGNGT